MGERGIIFTGANVRAIMAAAMAGTKTRSKLYVRKGEDPTTPEQLSRRLANGLDDAPADGCWIWQRATNSAGYGTMTVAGRQRYAHRLAYELGVGPIPAGAHLLHACDNPRCINPAHLRPGSRSDNMIDAVQKGRLVPPSVRICGERNGAAKLTAQQVDEIRALLAQNVRQHDIAGHFCVSQTLVSQISLGRIWR